MAQSDLLSTPAFAATVGVDRATVVRWIQDGHVAYTRLPGGQYRIPRSEADRLLTIHPAKKAAS